MIESVKKLYSRDLGALITEMESFNEESNIWEVKPGISNSAGNLCLHICGNLQHFIGAGIGNSGYIRERDLEFSLKDVPLAELIDIINRTKEIVISTLDKIQASDLDEIYPITLREESFTTEHFILHLQAHLNYHLGQINYLRRIIEGETVFGDQ